MQNKNMFIVILLSLLALVVVFPIVGIFLYSSYHDKAVSYQENLIKADENSHAVLSATTIKILNTSKVQKSYAADMLKLVETEMNGRYQGRSSDGSLMKFVQERSMNYDSSMYKEIMLLISSGYDEFKIAQQHKLDICGNYRIDSRNLWSGWWMGLSNMKFTNDPKNEDRCTLILDDVTNEAIKSKTIKTLDL